MTYTDVMLDLETVGTAPGSGIIAIGAVAFAPGMPEGDWAKLQVEPISRESCRGAGLTEDADTLSWWQLQGSEARAVFDRASDDQGVRANFSLRRALSSFADFLPPGAALWGNGANFDNVLLRSAFAAVEAEPPWRYYDDQCFRTMRRQHSRTNEPDFQGTRHSALADALHQARWLQRIWDDMKDREDAYEVYRRAMRECLACLNPQMSFDFDHLSTCAKETE